MKGPSAGEADYRAELCQSDKDPLRRVIRESVRIKRVDDEKEMVGVEVEEKKGGEEGGGEGEREREVVKVKVSLMNTKKEWFAPRMTSLGMTQL